jgi:PAS domain S-box-containing protein
MNARRRKYKSSAPPSKSAGGEVESSASTSRLLASPQRLELLYEISKLFVRFENVEETFDEALGLIARTLAIRSAILIDVEDGQPKMTLWPSNGQNSEQMRVARSRAEAAYSYLVGASPAETLDLSPHAGATALPRPPAVAREDDPGKRFIVIPLVVGRRGIFGALQLESAASLDKADLVFVNAIANQLAIAVDRQAAWRRDIARREQAEALADKHEALVDNLDRAFVWEVDARTYRPFYLSARAEKLLGHPRWKWLEGDGVLGWVHPDDRDRVQRTFQRALVEKKDQRCDHRCIALDGRVLWVHTGVHVVGAETNSPRLQGVTFDITAERAAEDDQRFLLAASKTLGASLDFPTMLNGLSRVALPRLGDFCFVDVISSGNEIRRAAWAHVNPSKERMLDEVFRNEPKLNFTRYPVSGVIRSGKSELVPNVDEVGPLASGASSEHLVPLRVFGVRSLITVPLMVAERKLGALTIAFAESGRRHGPTDLALAEELAARAALALENVRLYEQAQQAIRVREQILAIVSHDLRNPLGTVLSGASLLAKPGTSEDLKSALVPRMHRAAETMHRLVEDLLDFVNIEAGRLAIKLAPEDPCAILQEVVSNFQGVVHEKKLRLSLEMGRPMPRAYCDRSRVQQVLSNLVGNAVKFTPAGGLILLRVEARNRDVLFTVSDSGPGIGQSDLQHIFERYWRSSEADYKGSGLGLAIARGIVDAHGGRIWAESVPGAGASFFFTIPANTAEYPVHMSPS